jgi:hypothetical protein
MSHAVKLVSVVLALFLTSTGCLQTAVRPKTEPASAVTLQQQGDRPVIVHLATRDKVITIMSGADGPVFTVKTKDGEVLGEGLSEEALYAKFPGIEKVVNDSYAGQDRSSGRWIDASIHQDRVPITLQRERKSSTRK